eukprot:11932034-Karenia_brevis.AAC.1
MAVMTNQPAKLSQAFEPTITILREELGDHGMKIYWKPRKTEAMLAWRGSGSQVQCDKVCHRDGKRTLPMKGSRKRK